MILGISKNSNTNEMLTHLMALSYKFLAVTKMARWRGKNELLLEFFAIKVWLVNLMDRGKSFALCSLSAIK